MSDQSWSIFGLLRTVLASISEVGLLCVAGYVLARQDILDKKTQKRINRINISLFTPSLLFSKVAFSLTPEKLKELWIIPLVFVVTTLTSMGVAYGFGTVLRLRRSQKFFAMAAAMFMNSNSLPIALMQSLVYSVKVLRWGNDDTGDAMLGRALTYLVLYSTFGMVINIPLTSFAQLRWSYGVRLLTQADEESSEVDKDIEQPTERTSLLHKGDKGDKGSKHPAYSAIRAFSSPTVILHRANEDTEQPYSSKASASSSGASSPTLSPTLSRESSTPTVNGDHHYLKPLNCRKKSKKCIKARHFQNFPTTPVYPHSDTDSETSDSESSLEDSDSEEEPQTAVSRFIRRAKKRRCIFVRTWLRIKHIMHSINNFMTAPMWAALASLIVACIPSLQHFMMEHVRPIKGAINSAGNCSIPLTLIVLGGYFWTPEPEEVEKKVEKNMIKRIQKRLGLGEDAKGKGQEGNGYQEETRSIDDAASIVERVKMIFEQNRTYPETKDYLPNVHVHNPLDAVHQHSSS
ncbi:hypothetical protein M422DRAFT_69779 [Sphaerobolus stellatus SS14]|uniref:Auxin efflux carrier n=1 Tax=Sphaerobolus stellatus (strain SS14) TaxID=990650 RepID=A0A0C9VFM6_SPHS4|nr:hypothetical protein M422DRAFT_69779 [Sphaerobolus stellatus SS14]